MSQWNLFEYLVEHLFGNINILSYCSAGSRYETYDSLGASHMLRISGGLSAGDFSSFAYTRNLQQMGVGLTVSSDRESVTYTVESTANNQECGLLFLKEVIHPVFKPWEIDDMVPRIKTQVANVLPQVTLTLLYMN